MLYAVVSHSVSCDVANSNRYYQLFIISYFLLFVESSLKGFFFVLNTMRHVIIALCDLFMCLIPCLIYCLVFQSTDVM